MTTFVKILVKWCKQNGTTSSSSLFFSGKTLVILKSSVEDPCTLSKQIKKPPNFKTIPPTLFPPMQNFQNDKKKIEDFIILKYQNKNLQSS